MRAQHGDKGVKNSICLFVSFCAKIGTNLEKVQYNLHGVFTKTYCDSAVLNSGK